MAKPSTMVDGAQSLGGTLLKSFGVVLAVRAAEFVVDQAIACGKKFFGRSAAAKFTPKGKADKAKQSEAEPVDKKVPPDGKRKARKEQHAKESAPPAPCQPHAAAK